MPYPETTPVTIHKHTGGSSTVVNKGTTTEAITSLAADQVGDAVLAETVLAGGSKVVLTATANLQSNIAGSSATAYGYLSYSSVQLNVIDTAGVVSTTNLSLSGAYDFTGKHAYTQATNAGPAGTVAGQNENDVRVEMVALAGGGFVIAETSVSDSYSPVQNNNLYYEVLSANGTVTKPWTQVNSASAHDNDYFQLVANPVAGGFAIQWGENDIQQSYYQKFDATGAKAGSQIKLAGGNDLLAAFAVDNNGNVLVSTPTTDVFTSQSYTIYNAAGTQIATGTFQAADGGQLPGSTAIEEDQIRVQVVTLSTGQFLAVVQNPIGSYTSTGYSGYNVYVQTITVSGSTVTFGKLGLVETTSKVNTPDILNPIALSNGKVALNLSGTYVIVDPANLPSSVTTTTPNTLLFPTLTPSGTSIAATIGTINTATGTARGEYGTAITADNAGGIFAVLQSGQATSYYGTLDASTYAADFDPAPPTVAAGASVTFVRASTAVTVDAGLTVTAGNSPTLTGGTVTISNLAGGDTLNYVNQNGITGSFNTGTGVLTLSGTATAAQYQAALDSISFSTGNTAATGVRTLSYRLTDGSLSSVVVTSTVSVVQPVIGLAGLATATVTDAATVNPLAAATLSDSGGENDSLTITLTAGGTATDANGLLSGTGLTRTGTGTYTLATASAATLTNELRGLTFTPTAHQVAPGSAVSTVLGVTGLDAGGGSLSASETITATAVNTAPTVSGTAAGQAVLDKATIAPFTGVTVGDPDVSASETVTITLKAGSTATDADGVLSGTGLTKAGTGTYTLAAGSPGSVTTVLHNLVFTPTNHQVVPGSTVTTGFTLTVSDGTAATTNATTTVVATAATDAPTITGTQSGQATLDLVPVNPFSGVTINDVDFGTTPTVMITLKTPGGMATDANGTLTGTGLTKTGMGTYALGAASPGTLTTEIQGLSFSPTHDQVPIGQMVTTEFDIAATFNGVTGTNNGTSVVATDIACYCLGTLILTDRGEVAVEDLAIGDTVVTASGAYRPIRWIGRRAYAGRFLAANPGVQPILFRAGALGGGLPRRDLRVSPKHAMALDGMLIPTEHLVNGATITRDCTCDRVEYFHVELDQHDVLLAEGAPSESYVEDDNRGMFHNAAEWEAMYPGRKWLPAVYCAPRVESGFELEAVRVRLAAIAGEAALVA